MTVLPETENESQQKECMHLSAWSENTGKISLCLTASRDHQFVNAFSLLGESCSIVSVFSVAAVLKKYIKSVSGKKEVSCLP